MIDKKPKNPKNTNDKSQNRQKIKEKKSSQALRDNLKRRKEKNTNS